jgi:hypothetical protein
MNNNLGYKMKKKKLLIIILFSLFTLIKPVTAQSATEIIDELYNGGSDIIEQSKDLISLSVNAVWLASELTGTATITGTLTQSASNPNYWTYSSSPTDKLVVVFSNGSSIYFTFTTINGYTEGEAEDFIDNHVMDFVSVVNGAINLRIQSQTGPNGENIEWTRIITGSTQYNENPINVNINTTGSKHVVVDGGFAFGDYWDSYTGTITRSSMNFSMNNSETIHLAFRSSDALYVKERHIHNNSSVTGDFGSYAFSNLYCFYVGSTGFPDSANAGYFSNAIEVYNWVAQGELDKNNQYYGAIQFSSTPVEGTYGPKLVANCQDGNVYTLDPLLNWYLTGVENGEENLPANFTLSQNYPNPFNPTTTIKYSIPSLVNGHSLLVQLKIYDILGHEVTTLVNQKQVPGDYSVQFDASKLTSGIYFYRLQSGSFVVTKKMILLK